MSLAFALLAGLLFGIGLIVGGATDPAKIQNFLDIWGDWDPSLGLVMAGAVAVGLIAFAIARRRNTAWSGTPIDWPTERGIDTRLIIGAALYGAGWGWAGLCPGPALVAAADGYAPAVVFVPAMLVGMTVHDQLVRPREQP